MILYDDFRMVCLYQFRQFSEHSRLSDTRHILQADFCSSGSDKLVGDVRIVFCSVDRRSSDTESSLWSHASLQSPFDTWYDVSDVVKTAEDTCDVNALCMFYFILQGSNIVRNRIHAESI